MAESRTLSSDTHGAFLVPGIRNDTGWLELQADCLAQPRRNLSLNEPVNWKSYLCWLCLFGTELCFLVPLSPNVKKNPCFYMSVKHRIVWSTCPFWNCRDFNPEFADSIQAMCAPPDGHCSQHLGNTAPKLERMGQETGPSGKSAGDRIISPIVSLKQAPMSLQLIKMPDDKHSLFPVQKQTKTQLSLSLFGRKGNKNS